ncbi:Eco57I restriction-modification methylase domain-containing protein [Candidatus Saccharibacteria bacterium]|nr:MAG: Eco57I restriction-modification methylase domain-containing protein [Candidatus Saccharibacteria bacterium]
MDGGKDMPIYPYFYDLAEKVSDRYCLISPARFLFGAGATRFEWNNKMLSDEHLKVMSFHQDSSSIFPGTDIMGGVAVMYRDANTNFGAIKTFTPFPELNSILEKVENELFNSISGLIYGVTSYTFSTRAYQDYPDLPNRVGKGSGNQLTSGIFDAIPEIFLEKKQNDNQIQIYGRQSNERVYKWVESDYVRVPENLNSFKVLVPAANGSGAIGEIIPTPLIGQPLIAHPESVIPQHSYRWVTSNQILRQMLY